MKLFKTTSGSNTFTSVIVFVPKDDKTIVKQYTDSGIFQNVIDHQFESTFAVNKDEFHKAMSIIKDATLKETAKSLIIANDDVKKVLKKINQDEVPQVGFGDFTKEDAKELPLNFFYNLKNAAKFTDPTNQNLIFRGVKVDESGVSAGDRFKMTFIKQESEISEISIPVKSIAAIQTLTHYIQTESDIIFTNKDFSEIAKIKLYAGTLPKYETAVNRVMEGAREIDVDMNKLKEAINNVIAFGIANDSNFKLITIKLSDGLLEADNGYSQKLNLVMGGMTVHYVADVFKLSILDGKMYMPNVVENPPVMFFKEGQYAMTTAFRVGEND